MEDDLHFYVVCSNHEKVVALIKYTKQLALYTTHQQLAYNKDVPSKSALTLQFPPRGKSKWRHTQVKLVSFASFRVIFQSNITISFIWEFSTGGIFRDGQIVGVV